MTHLHDRVTALVDGELSPAARCRALSHLRHCAACRDAVEAERRTRRLTAQAPPVEPSAELVARLVALGGPDGPLRPRDGHLPGTPRVPPLPAPGREPRPVRTRTARPSGRARQTSHAAAAPPARPDVARPAAGPRRLARLARRGLALAVVGTVSLATVGVLGVGLLGGAVRVPAAAEPVLGRLVVERAGVAGDTSVVVPVARVTRAEAAPAPRPTP